MDKSLEALTSIARFLQEQILQMRWIDASAGWLLEHLGVDTTTRLGAALQFFIFDTVKITILLCTLIFLISYIQSYFPPERSKRLMANFSGIGANAAAALLGTVTPFCSCSSIPLFIGFTSAGLPIGVTFSFLISSPMVDLASLALLSSIFGLKIALAYVLLGLTIAILGGLIIQRLGMEQYIEEFILQAQTSTLELAKPTRTQRLQYAKEQMLTTLRKVFPYILLGVGIGAFIHSWIPATYIQRALGADSPWGVPIATLVGIPMYADIFGTIPVAEALLAKGASLGTVLAFMMAVTTLSFPSMVMLRQAIKPRLLAAFITICFAGIIIVGYLFNLLQDLFI